MESQFPLSHPVAFIPATNPATHMPVTVLRTAPTLHLSPGHAAGLHGSVPCQLARTEGVSSSHWKPRRALSGGDGDVGSKQEKDEAR